MFRCAECWKQNSSYINKRTGNAFGNVKLSVGVQTGVYVQAQLVPNVSSVAPRTWVPLQWPDIEKWAYFKDAGRVFLHRAKESAFWSQPLLCFHSSPPPPPPCSHLRHLLMLVWTPPISCDWLSYYKLPSLHWVPFHRLPVLELRWLHQRQGKTERTPVLAERKPHHHLLK